MRACPAGGAYAVTPPRLGAGGRRAPPRDLSLTAQGFSGPGTGGGPAGTTTTITQFLYNYGIKPLDFGYGSAGAIVMTVLVLILSSFYIKRAMG